MGVAQQMLMSYGAAALGMPAPNPDPLHEQTALSLSFDGVHNATTVADLSRFQRGVSFFGNLKLSNAFPLLVGQTTSAAFDGVGDYAVVDNTALWFGASDATIAFDMRANSIGATQALVINFGVSGSNAVSLVLNTVGTIEFAWSTDGTNVAGTASSVTSAIAANTNNHVQVDIVSGSVAVSVNGVRGTPQTIAAPIFNSNTPCYIGMNPAGVNSFNGYMANLNIVIGAARHSANFTPYTTPYSNTTGGALTPLYATFGGTFNMTRSNSDKTVSESTSSDICATASFSTTRDWYVEITASAVGGAFDAAIGVRQNAQLNTVNFATGKTLSVRAAGTTFVGTTGVTPGTGTSYVTTNVIGLAKKGSNIFAHKNGTYMNGGNPVANTGALFPSIPGDGWMPFVGGDNGTGSHTFTINAGASAFAYSVPTGIPAGLFA